MASQKLVFRRWNVFSRITLVICLTLGIFLSKQEHAQADMFETSVGFSFNKTNYGGGNYNWSRRYGVNLGYNITDLTQIEFGYQNVRDRTKIEGYEDTTFDDEIYKLTWVQTLLPKSSPIQPFSKLGIGQLNREATGTYVGGSSPPRAVDSVTGILGAGLRIYLTRTFAIRAEVESYLQGGQIRKWKDNIGITFGISAVF